MNDSPRWGATTKLVVGLTFVGIVAAMLVQFRQVIGPLILAFLLAYLMHLPSNYLSRVTHLSWRSAVSIVYLLFVIVLIALLAGAGIAIVQQAESLINFVQRFLTDLPTLIAEISQQKVEIGPFQLDFSLLDLSALTDQLLSVAQSLVREAGGLISSLAASTVVGLGWGFFVLIVSYFLLAETGEVSAKLVNIDLPGYDADIHRLSSELGRIWGAFLRGQLILSALAVVTYTIMLSALGTRFALVIALMAGAARFVPYIGTFITWTVTVLVAYFQSSNYFNLESLQYAGLVLVACLIVDQIFDNIISPRMMGDTLGVHPAAVMVAAIVAANLLGIVGLVMAAPALATLNLAVRYTLRKMFDLDPWPEKDVKPKENLGFLVRAGRRLRAWWRLSRGRQK